MKINRQGYRLLNIDQRLLTIKIQTPHVIPSSMQPSSIKTIKIWMKFLGFMKFSIHLTYVWPLSKRLMHLWTKKYSGNMHTKMKTGPIPMTKLLPDIVAFSNFSDKDSVSMKLKISV